MGAQDGDGVANELGLPRAYTGARRLGSGAEGGTWLATDRGTGRCVVLKRVEPTRVHIVRRAFELLRRVGSPHLPAPRALTPGLAANGEPDGSHWLATDFVEGSALPSARTDRVTALREALAVAHALAAIHRAGTHHGDVAPGNVIVTGTGGVILVDLGQLGQHGTGTPGFIAPEVLAGGGGPGADRFALGSLLCLRMYGDTPWRRPDALLGVRGRQGVRQRVVELATAAGVDPPAAPLMRVLELLLHPEPRRRIAASDLLVARIASLARAAEAGVDLPAHATWWLPQRWPFRPGPDGPDVAATATRLADAGGPRLVAIAGPPGVGRRRVVEELVQQLQTVAGAPSAVACDPEAAGAIVGDPTSTWIEAWIKGSSQPGTSPEPARDGGHPHAVLGLVSEPAWPSLGPDGEGDDGDRIARGHAAMLIDAAASAATTLIVPVGQRLARALTTARQRQQMEATVVVLRVRPWDPQTLSHALGEVLQCEDAQPWVSVLLDATGGWPGRIVKAVTACAELGVQSPSPAAVERALETMPAGAVLGLDAAAAGDVMRAWWTSDADALARLPGHLHDGVAPRAAAVTQARRQLGSGLTALAAATLAERPASARTSLALAVDADRADLVDAALGSGHALVVGQRGAGAVLRWLEAGGAHSVSDRAVAVACRGLLGDGDARRALALATIDEAGPACRLEAGRAAQRLGRPDDALAHLELAARAEDADLRAAAVGLRWRIMVDRGDAAAAVGEAKASMAEHPEVGVGAGTARLWAAMAALVAGDDGVASRWLDEAEASVRTEALAPQPDAGSVAAAAAGVAARVCQLRGNVAQSQGDLGAAQRFYAAAADAFASAREPVGGLLVRGSLAGLSIATFDTSRGIADGRWALRGLVARGQLSATLEAALNLVQLLVRIGANEQAAAVGALADALFAPRTQHDRLVRGRLCRIEAALARRTQPRAAEDAFVAAAVDLEAAGAGREAVEAWVCAASVSDAAPRAAAHLDRARAVAADDEDSRAAIATATLERLVAATPDRRGPQTRVAVDRALLAVQAIGQPQQLAARGRLDLSWAVARSVALAMHHRLAPGHPARNEAATQLLAAVQIIMNKTDPNDRAAVVASLTADVGERSALQELMSELTGDGPAREAPPATSPVTAAPRREAPDRMAGFFRVYRRLAREERLEPLLEQVVDAVMELTDAERGAVVVLPQSIDGQPAKPSDTRLEVTRELAAGGEGVRFSRSVIDRVLAQGEPVLSVDAAHDDRFDGSRSISHLNLRSVLAVPLRFRGELFGAVYVDHRLRRGAFDEDDLARMEEFADLAALAVAHARALSGLRAQAQELEQQRQRLSGLLEVREAEVEGLRGRVRDTPAEAGAVRHGMVGTSAGMQKVFRLIDRLADSDVPVVIHGESGTGKELAARATHDAGPRRDAPFIAENCGAIPETLLESVLFGHARGAFTGAAKSKAGLFEAANGGTIFLDEVGEMSPGMQTKLLRVLQEGEIRRVGETQPRPVDVRVIAASNRDLDAMVKEGTFRRDLYYRIHVVKLVLPPLREREGDLPALVQHLARRRGAHALTVSAPAMRLLCRHAWPGNVRELDNEVQRWIALSEGTVEVDDLSPELVEQGRDAPDAEDLQIRPRVDRLERDLIKQALERTSGNQTKAATLLGLSRFGLQKKLRRMAEADAEAAGADGAEAS